ncbi:hypothetical protein HKX48_007481 [Thoreauomyces humboldtii]|nr:hypothetical protein HKX48_007481 [Thoreauomyces humboldtii]
MQKKYGLMKKGMVVLDLGGCPGGWAQVAVKYALRNAPLASVQHPQGGEAPSPASATSASATSRSGPVGRVISIDLLPTDPIPGATLILGDMTDPKVQQRVYTMIRPPVDGEMETKQRKDAVDVVLSDMAHPFTGSRTADVARVIDLCELALSVAERPGMLKAGGSFVCKFLQGEGDTELRQQLKSKFARVVYEKPEASRTRSAEGYLVCLGYTGRSDASAA